jgi:hypothetical protein
MLCLLGHGCEKHRRCQHATMVLGLLQLVLLLQSDITSEANLREQPVHLCKSRKYS